MNEFTIRRDMENYIYGEGEEGKLTDNEIIKALEEHIERTKNIKYGARKMAMVDVGLLKDTLDIINRKNAEIERLKSPVLVIDNLDLSEDEIAEKIRKLPVQIFPYNDDQIKAEAVKEFAERLKENSKIHYDYDANLGIQYVETDIIDNLVKEMERGKNEYLQKYV